MEDREEMIYERTLIDNILSGERDSFRTFIERYRRLVGQIVYRMISDQTDRDEVCQEVFVKIYQNLKKFKFQARLSTWIAKITYNTCLNHLQKKKTYFLANEQTSENVRNSTSEEIPDNAELPDIRLIREQVSTILLQVMEELPNAQRVILTLFHLQEMSYKEIATILNLPEGTVKNYLFRARRKLKEKLLQQYDREEIYQ